MTRFLCIIYVLTGLMLASLSVQAQEPLPTINLPTDQNVKCSNTRVQV